MTHIGIDPGASGAIAIVWGGRVDVFDTPFIKPTKGKGDYDTSAMVRLLEVYTPVLRGDEPAHVTIESVHAMPGQGVTSMFSFGRGFGIWIGIVSALKIPYTLVAPQRWKKLMLADMKQDKDFSRIRAQQLWPSQAALFARKKDDGRAEAALMAEYARRTHGGPVECVSVVAEEIGAEAKQ